MNNLYVNTIKKYRYLYIYIVLIIEPYSCVTDDILCVWTFGLPGLYNVIKIIIIIIIIHAHARTAPSVYGHGGRDRESAAGGHRGWGAGRAGCCSPSLPEPSPVPRMRSRVVRAAGRTSENRGTVWRRACGARSHVPLR